MTEYEIACSSDVNRMNPELDTRNREGWEPINLAIGKAMVCVLFRKH